ncbi:MAG: peptidase, partial [Acidobacteria bacterium]|nr:peptidase [Acidobacteriota bacterium]
RDWLAHQHPESRGRLALFHAWKPNVQLDFHEQGSERSYFFMPGKPERVNPLTPAINQDLTEAIAAYHRPVFDREGILYFSQEGYDDFFVGKGSTYPDLFGCVGILFEQPSSRGAHQETQNGLLTFPFSISNQFRASLSSVAATAALKDELLQYQMDFYADSLKQGKSAGGYYLATANGDPTRLREFVRVLQGHQIEVKALAKSKRVDGQLYPSHSSIAVPLAQRHYPFLQTLWERRTEFEEDIFYDVSAWTMPLAFNLQHTSDPVKRVATKALPASFHTPANASDLEESPVGYLIDWRDSASPALLYALLDAEANVRVATRPFTATLAGGEQREFGYGSLFVGKALNPNIPDEALRLLRDAAASGAPVFPAMSSSTRSGIDLGSGDFEVLEKPKVILVTGSGMSQYDVGEIWHLFDQRLGMPITMVDWTRLGRISLSDYTHVLLTRDLGALRDSALNKLKAFVTGGGILWAQENRAVTWVIEKKLAEGVWRMTEEEKNREAREKAGESGQDDRPSKTSTVERRPFVDARDQRAFKQINGAIFATSLDVTHPIGYGYTSEHLPVIRSSARFLEPSSNAYSTPVQYLNDPLLAGYVSAENLELMSNSASLVIDQQGRGAVVLALDNPSFRAFWWGTQRLLVNAVFFGELLVEP